MVKAFTALLMIALALVILVCIMIAHAADWDPAWEDEDWEKEAKKREKR